jgi:photosystem II stability/assembly factor-like uncharacterized protein
MTQHPPTLRPIPRTRAQQLWRIVRWFLLAYLLIVAIGVASTHEMFAHELEWQAQEIPVGMLPIGTTAFISSLISSPDGEIVYVGTWEQGVFQSADGGKTWESSNKGLNNLNVQTFIFSPTLDKIYIGTWGGGVFQSSDEGQTWEAINNGLTNLNVWTVIFSPDGEDMYVGTVGGGVFRSSDDGKSWESTNNGLTDLWVQTLTFSPIDETIYIGTYGGGVFRSSDGGASWEPANNGLTSRDVLTLLFSPTGETLYAGTRGGGVFRSTNGGESWKPTNNGLTNQVVLTLILSPIAETIYVGTWGGGVFSSNDGGDNWQITNNGLTNLDVVTLLLSPMEETLYAGTWGSGVFSSSDGGASWEPANNGLADIKILMLRFSPTGESLYTNIDGEGLFRSDDGGVSWTATEESADWFFLPVDGYQLTLDKQQRLALHDPHLLAPIPWVRRWQGTEMVATHIDSLTQTAMLARLVGNRQLLRAEAVPLPLVYRLPFLLLYSVSAVLAARLWLQANWFALLLVGLVILLATYLFVIRPNHLSTWQILYLIRHPAALFSSNGFADFSAFWAGQVPVTRLLVLLAPVRYQFEPAYLVQLITKSKGYTNETEVINGLHFWTEQSRIFTEVGDGWWQVRRPTFVALQQRHRSVKKQLFQLVEATHHINPRFRDSTRFLEAAGFTVSSLAPQLLRATTSAPAWARTPQLLVVTLLEQPLSRNTLNWCIDLAHEHLPADQPRHLLAIINQPPQAGDIHQIVAIQGQEGLHIIPLPFSIIQQAQLNPATPPAQLLRQQIELYTGQANLYDLPAAVSDVLSFFGRQTLLAELKQKLLDGRPLMLYGVRKMGKSSLMQRFREEVAWPSALVDLQGFGGHLEGVYTAALQAWGQTIPPRYPDQTWDKALFTLSDPDLPEAPALAFRQRVMQLLAQLATASPDRPPGLLLLLDEMEFLFGDNADQPDKFISLALTLREISESSWGRGRFGLLIAGLDPAVNRIDRYQNERNPFFAFFGNLPLPPLEPADTAEMITSIGGQMGLTYEGDALAYLTEIGGGHPYLTRQLCSTLYKRLIAHHGQQSQPLSPTQRHITLEMAQQAVTHYTRNPRNYLDASLWENSGSAVQTMLHLLVQGEAHTAEELLATFITHGGTRREGALALQELEDQSLLREMVDGQLRFTIPLYEQYIRTMTNTNP